MTTRRPLALRTAALATLLAGGLAAAPGALAAPVPDTLPPEVATRSATSTTAATAYDPEDATVVPAHVSGDPAKRWNLVILGDGYTAEEMGDFDEAVERHLNVMWSIEPYRSYKNYINVYAVQIPSVDSGTSCEDGPDGPRLDTPLTMQFWSGCRTNGIERLLVIDNAKARVYAELVPEYDQILALSNSSLYGGAGGSYATASANSAMSALISPHELGHSFGRLQDEYDYYNRGETTGAYTGREPSSIHHTIRSVDELAEGRTKWWRWLGEFSESGGQIGAFEGGMYYSTGIYRPSLHSQMKSLGFYMDQVSREVVAANISSRISLVEESTPTDAPVARDGKIYVDTAYPVYHPLDVTWTVNDRVVPKAQGERVVDLRAIGARAGDVVEATMVDPTDVVRDPALRERMMTQVLSWTVGTATSQGEDVDAAVVRQHSPNDTPVGRQDVLWVHTSHPDHDHQVIEWRLDRGTPGGRLLARGPQLELADVELPETATVKVSVFDRRDRHSASVVRWQVDTQEPRTQAVVGEAVAQGADVDGVTHYVADETFTMDLIGSDDTDGYVVREFRVNGDGWHHFYGWPSDSTQPFRFTPTGLNVDDLIYGNLGTAGISLSPFFERTPGYGTHEIEYRSIDAAGNIASADRFRVTVRDPQAETEPALDASAFAHCESGEVTIDVSVTNTGGEPRTVVVAGEHGSVELGPVVAGASASGVIATGGLTIENGLLDVSSEGAEPVTVQIPHNRYACFG